MSTMQASDGDDLSDSFTAITRALASLRKQVSALKDKNRALGRENERLSQQIDALHGAEEQGTSVQPRRGRSGKEASLEKRLAALEKRFESKERENEKLRKEVARQKKTINKLERKELWADADELLNEAEHGVPDAEHRMRKLLRRFSDLMVLNVLGDGDDCSICLETLELGKCSSLPCQHVFCDGCLGKLKCQSTGVARPARPVTSFSCPTCRKDAKSDDLEPVQHSAQAQWDDLLKIANEFGEMDRQRGPMDTSDEEREEYLRENFIDDGTSHDASSAASEAPGEEELPMSRRRIVARRAAESDDGLDDGEMPSDDEPAPGSSQTPSYVNASPSDKKRKLEELAARRSKKPRP